MIYTSDTEGKGAGMLLTQPQDEQASFARCSAEYENHSERFKITERNFQRQYAHLYASRLLTLWSKLKEAAKLKWGKKIHEHVMWAINGILHLLSNLSKRALFCIWHDMPDLRAAQCVRSVGCLFAFFYTLVDNSEPPWNMK